jgi:CRP-like cAMP-binding protein
MKTSPFFDYPADVTSARADFLGHLHEDEIARVLSYMQSRRYAPGDLVIHRGEHDRSLYIITRGQFEVVLENRGRRKKVQVFRPGDIFGELAFFDGEPRSAEVRAITESEALVMTPAGFDRLRLADPRLSLAFVMDLGRVLSGRFRDFNRLLLSHSGL